MGLRFTPGAAVKHPFGVKPEGNLFLVDDVRSVLIQKRDSMGAFSALIDDSLVLTALGFLDGADLLVLGTTSKYMAGFANHVDLWRDLFWASEEPQQIRFGGTWKHTWMNCRSAKKMRSSQPTPLENVFSDTLYSPFRTSGLTPVLPAENVDRVAFSTLTRESFSQTYEAPNKPVVVTGLSVDSASWTLEALVDRFAQIGDPVLACGAAAMRMSEFVKYIESGIWRTDEAPLFVFDYPQFSKLLQTEKRDNSSWPGAFITSIQSILSPDLYDLLEPPFRPEHSWLLVGSDGASSKWHVDPNSTSAWNTVISGAKYWLLLPPHLGPPPGVECSGDGFAVRQPLTLSEWFEGFYKETKARFGTQLIECVCRPGETVFVPRGWWHCVRNIGLTVAVTQNYVPECALSHVRQFLKKFPHCVSGIDMQYRPQLGKQFDDMLRLKRADLSIAEYEEEVSEEACEEDTCGEPCSFWAAFETSGRSLNFNRNNETGMLEYITSIPSSMWGFVSRNKYRIGAVAAAGSAVYYYYGPAIRNAIAIYRLMNEMGGSEESPAKPVMDPNLKKTTQTSDETATDLFPSLRDHLADVYEAELLRVQSELRAATSDKERLFRKLLTLYFARLVTATTVNRLSLLLARVEVCLIGRVHRRGPVDAGQREDHRELLSAFRCVVGSSGFVKKVDLVSRQVVVEVLKEAGISPTSNFDPKKGIPEVIETILNTVIGKLKSTPGSGKSSHWNWLLGPDYDESEMPLVCNQTLDVLESPQFGAVLTFVMKHTVTTAFTRISSQQTTNSVPFASLLPGIKTEVDWILSPSETSYSQLFRDSEVVSEFSLNLYADDSDDSSVASPADAAEFEKLGKMLENLVNSNDVNKQ